MKQKSPGHQNRSWGILLGLCISALCLYLVSRKLDLPAFLAELQQTNWSLYFFIVLLAVLHNFLMAGRWHLLLSRTDSVSFSDAFWSLRISYFLNCILPAKLGEPARLLFLKRKRQVSMAHSLGAHIADKLLDASSLLVLLLLAALVLGFRNQAWIADSLVILLLVAGIIFLVLRFLPSDSARKGGIILRFIAKAKTGMKILLDPKILFMTAGYSFMGWFLHALIIWGLILGVGESMSLFKALIVVGAVSLAAAVPASPGNFGPFELAAIACLNGVFKLDREKAVSIALLYHLAQLIPTLGFGLIGYFRYGLGGRRGT